MVSRSEIWYAVGVVFTLAFAGGYALGLWMANVRGLL